MLNYIWLSLVLLAVVIGGYNGVLDQVTKEGFTAAEKAVMNLALPLSAIFTIWLGVMRLAEKSGLILYLARAMRPIMRWLFPEVPPEHPAMGAMVMNIAANMLGLSNAATPVGLRAMSHLQKLNPNPGTATDAMCMFLAINTASVQLIPATAVGILAVAGSTNPTAIVGTAFIATVCAASMGVFSAKLFRKFRIFSPTEPMIQTATTSEVAKEVEAPLEAFVEPAKLSPRGKILLSLFLTFFVYLFFTLMFPNFRLQNQFPEIFPELPMFKPVDINSVDASQTAASFWKVLQNVVKAISILALPFFLSFFPVYAALRKIKVYEEFTEGAKEGFQVAIRIIPFLVAILTAVGMFRGAGGIALITKILKPALDFVHFPTDLLPLVLMRPLSGSGSIALLSDLVKTNGPNDIVSLMGATILGSTETTFYVIAVYFGSVGIRRTRYAVASGLLADLTSVIASIIICRLMFG